MSIHLPTLNASLNGLAAVLLILGWRSIRQKNTGRHKVFMISALAASTLFLTSYVTYHYLKKGVVTKYEGEGILRAVYFFILATHIPLAAIVVPMSLTAVYFALKQNFTAHVKLVKWLFPIWVYVSVTGVLIYVMLYLM